MLADVMIYRCPSLRLEQTERSLNGTHARRVIRFGPVPMICAFRHAFYVKKSISECSTVVVDAFRTLNHK